MNKPTLFAMLRVKNEAQWIMRCLDSLNPLGETFISAEDIFVLDDCSDDGTELIVKENARLVRSPFLFGLDESRDKNYLLGRLLHHGCPGSKDWILCIDGDEAIAPESIDVILRAISNPTADAYSLKIEYLWGDTQHVRTDGWLGNFWRGSLWRVGAMTEGFRCTQYPGNLHCSNIPGGFGVVKRIPARILHYGYVHKADRLAKFQLNKQRDPQNIERYEQLVIGDAFPADANIGDCGPLQVIPLKDLPTLENYDAS